MLPLAQSIRPHIKNVVKDAQVQRARERRAVAIPQARTGETAFRCVVCTLPGGTCKHNDAWAFQASQQLLEFEERSSIHHIDDVDVQLADIMEIVGVRDMQAKDAGLFQQDAFTSHTNLAANDAPKYRQLKSKICQGVSAAADGQTRDDIGVQARLRALPEAESAIIDCGTVSKNEAIVDESGGTNDDVIANAIEKDDFQRDANGHLFANTMRNSVKNIRDLADTSPDTIEYATKLLRGNSGIFSEEDRIAGRAQRISPWEISASRGATGSHGLRPPPPLRNYRWTYPEQKATDKIAGVAIDLSTPSPRGGHSLVSINSFTLIAFGGFYYQREPGGDYEPFTDYKTSIVENQKEQKEESAHYLNDVRVYDTVSECWSLLENVRVICGEMKGQEGPIGRFGHCAIALEEGVQLQKDSLCNTGSVKEVWRKKKVDDDEEKDTNKHETLPTRKHRSNMEVSGGIMWIFGGRCANGLCSNECWLLHWHPVTPAWELVGPKDDEVLYDLENKIGLSSENLNINFRAWPPGRFDAAATNCRRGIYVALYGGRDLTGRNFGDLWMWRRLERIWEQPLLAGVPPVPRYGHALIALPGTNGNELLILGGCCVSAAAVDGVDDVHSNVAKSIQMQISLATQRVASAYDVEVAQSNVVATNLRADAMSAGHVHIQSAWRGMVRNSATAAAALATREFTTRSEEEYLRDLLLEEGTNTRWTQLNGSNDYHIVEKGAKARCVEPPHIQASYNSAQHFAVKKGTGLAGVSNNNSNTRCKFESSCSNMPSTLNRRSSTSRVDGMLIDLMNMMFIPLEAQGLPPVARVHSVVLPIDCRIVVFGGEKPIEAAHREHRQVCLVDEDKKDISTFKSKKLSCTESGCAMEIFVLDMSKSHPLFGCRGMKTGRWKWLRPPAENSPGWLETIAMASEVAVRRSERILHEMRANAQSKGIPGGNNSALEEAKSHIKVARWRAHSIRKEQAMATSPPTRRTRCASAIHGYRIFVHGGWRSDRCLRDLIAIDLEEPDERQRRLKEEFSVRLEREIRGKGVADAMNKREREYQDELCAALQRKKQSYECSCMALEDKLSALPPLTRGPMPRCVCANASTIWLQWDSVTKDARGLPIEKNNDSTGTVYYYLSMKAGFSPIAVGQRVRVAHVKRMKTSSARGCDKKCVDAKSEHNLGVDDTSQSSVSISKEVLMDDGRERFIFFRGYIKKIHAGRYQGFFDVQYDDGSKDYRVQRYRIQPEEEPSWQLIYVGQKTEYEAQGLVPEFILQKETNTAVSCTFCVQTQFTEYKWDEHRGFPTPSEELSLRSCSVTFKTKNIVKELNEGRVSRRFKESIELDHYITLQLTSGTNFETSGGINADFI